VPRSEDDGLGNFHSQNRRPRWSVLRFGGPDKGRKGAGLKPETDLDSGLQRTLKLLRSPGLARHGPGGP